MNATIIYSKSSLPETSTTVVIGDKTMSCSLGCAVHTVGHYTGDPAHYEFVATVPTKGDDERACEVLFEQFNIGDRAGLRCRSMSVGDVIAFSSGRTFVVQGCGWLEVVGLAEFLDALAA